MKRIPTALVALFFTLFWISTEVSSQCKVDLSISSDAQIHDVNSSTNYGHSQELMAKRSTNGSVTPIQRALFNFDWNCLPDDITIDSARLFLFNKQTSAGNTHQGDNISWLQRIDQGWGEMTVTWDNQPTTTTNNQLVLPSQSGNDDLNILITQLVQDIMNEPEEERHGLLMRLQSETDIRRQNYASSDEENDELHPVLTVYYANPKVSVTAQTTAGSEEIVPGDTASLVFEICNESCCKIHSESLSLILPLGFSVASSNINPAAAASFANNILSINDLPAGECFKLYLDIKSQFKTSLGAYDFCLTPNDSLEATGDLCASTKLVETASINQVSRQGNSLRVFPNPNQGKFLLDLGDFNSITELVVIDVLGKEVYHSRLTQKEQVEIDLSHLPKGFYSVIAVNEAVVSAQKVVIE